MCLGCRKERRRAKGGRKTAGWKQIIKYFLGSVILPVSSEHQRCDRSVMIPNSQVWKLRLRESQQLGQNPTAEQSRARLRIWVILPTPTHHPNVCVCVCVCVCIKMGKVRLGNFPNGICNAFDKFLKPSLFSNLSLSTSFFSLPLTVNSLLENLLYTKYIQLMHSLI